MSPSIAVVICHYNPVHSFFLRSIAMLCVASIVKDSDSSIQVVLCDGSPESDPILAAEIVRNQAIYLHAGKELSFGETYNLGIKNSNEENVVLIANDIQITSKQIKKLIDKLEGNIACTIPYLTHADYLTQARSKLNVPRVCFPSSMTINVNAFKRKTLEEIGYVPEELSGAFNDIVMFSRMRAMGYRIGLVNVGVVHHLGQTTLSVSSTVRFGNDIKVAARLLPSFFSEKNIEKYTARNYFDIYAKSAQTFFSKVLWKITSILPLRSENTQRLASMISKIEPFISIDYKGFSRAINTLRSSTGKNLWKKY